jgi:hypothetical protein
MPAATRDRIRDRQDRITATMQAANETIRQSLLEKCKAIVEAQIESENDLQEAMREGIEKDALREILATLESQVEREREWFTRAQTILDGDADAVGVIQSQLQAAQAFFNVVRGLQARISAVETPFDESRLPPTPTGPTAEGYIGISEARSRGNYMEERRELFAGLTVEEYRQALLQQPGERAP